MKHYAHVSAGEQIQNTLVSLVIEKKIRVKTISDHNLSCVSVSLTVVKLAV